MKKYIILPLVCVALAACEKTIDFDIPYDPPKLTIDVKLQSEQIPKAIVGTSQFSMSSKNPKLDSLSEVFLYEDGILIDEFLPRRYSSNIYDSQGRPITAYYYEGNYLPMPGHTYEVKAQREGFTEASGSGYMYEPVEIFQSNYDTETGDLVVSFVDPAGEGDYYRVSIFPRGQGSDSYYNSIFGTYDPTIEFFETEDIDDFFDTNGLTFGYAGYLKDEFFDGKLKKLKLVYYGGYEEEPQTNSFDIIIERITEDYYKHERSKALQFIDNPFSEPTPLYGNIKNGYGIVGTAGVSRVYIQP